MHVKCNNEFVPIAFENGYLDCEKPAKAEFDNFVSNQNWSKHLLVFVLPNDNDGLCPTFNFLQILLR